jgi:crotonobetainyl-CoA:carnitine CoA-transferase CaiB-like acyl-CoA transferase
MADDAHDGPDDRQRHDGRPDRPDPQRHGDHEHRQAASAHKGPDDGGAADGAEHHLGRPDDGGAADAEHRHGGAGDRKTDGPLADLRVIDLATVVAGPGAARHLADFGADVIKVERPDGHGDGTRSMGWRDPTDDVTLWWKLIGRNKRTITLDLKAEHDHATFLRLVDTADVVIENFRPGTLERLGLDPETVLLRRNPKLVVTRVTGFGQTGPYAQRPGFATLAEAMSGFAGLNGDPGPDSQPLLPPVALTDEITGLAAAFATMVALHSGRGQVVDVNLLESMLQMMGPLPAAAARLGYDQPRLGSGIPYSVPRNTYRTQDGRWVAISTSSESVAARVLDLVGLDAATHPELRTSAGRADHRHHVDAAVARYVGERTEDEVLRAFLDADAAIAPVLAMTQVIDDPHVVERDVLPTVEGLRTQAPIARLSATPGRIRWLGRAMGQDTEAVLAELDQDH